MRKMSLSRISRVLKLSEIFEEAKCLVKILFRLFLKDTFESFARLALEILGEKGIRVEDTEAKLSLVRTRCFLGELLPLLKMYNEKRCLIKEPKSLPREIQRMCGTPKLEPSRILRNSLFYWGWR